MSSFVSSYIPPLVTLLEKCSCPSVLVRFPSVRDILRCHFQTLVPFHSEIYTLCILSVFVFCVFVFFFSPHPSFLAFLSLIFFLSFCLTQQSSLLDCISQSCISACCNLVPWSNKVLCPQVGPSSCLICSLMLLVAFSTLATFSFCP